MCSGCCVSVGVRESSLQTSHKVVYTHQVFFQISFTIAFLSLCTEEKDKPFPHHQLLCLPVRSGLFGSLGGH